MRRKNCDRCGQSLQDAQAVSDVLVTGYEGMQHLLSQKSTNKVLKTESSIQRMQERIRWKTQHMEEVMRARDDFNHSPSDQTELALHRVLLRG